MNMDYTTHARYLKNDFARLKQEISDRWSNMCSAFNEADQGTTKRPADILQDHFNDLDNFVKRIVS